MRDASPDGGGTSGARLRAALSGRGAFSAVVLSLLLSAWTAPAGGQVMDRAWYTFVAVDELEYAPGTHEEPFALDGQLWIGGDYNRLWIKAEGERSTVESAGEYEAQALYSRLVAPFWDAQVGLRVDLRDEAGRGSEARAHLALGLEGLAPYWFELEPAFFVSQDGDVSARLEASYDLLFTQRLVLEPELEANLALQDVPEWGVGSGLGDLELSGRLRYEIVRELAPYLGFSWHRRIGETADLAREAGMAVSDGSVVMGIRAWW